MHLIHSEAILHVSFLTPRRAMAARQERREGY